MKKDGLNLITIVIFVHRFHFDHLKNVLILCIIFEWYMTMTTTTFGSKIKHRANKIFPKGLKQTASGERSYMHKIYSENIT